MKKLFEYDLVKGPVVQHTQDEIGRGCWFLSSGTAVLQTPGPFEYSWGLDESLPKGTILTVTAWDVEREFSLPVRLTRGAVEIYRHKYAKAKLEPLCWPAMRLLVLPVLKRAKNHTIHVELDL